MHGPTFMGNPLACAAAIANIDVLMNSPWQDNIQRIEEHFTETLLPLKELDGVADTRVLGAIGVIELERSDLGPQVQAKGIENGIWLRPFGKLVYTMPAYNMSQTNLSKLTNGIIETIHSVNLKTN
jgi:Adenosylmethionine-8-amino-7-oxononanoate aminotransferase